MLVRYKKCGTALPHHFKMWQVFAGPPETRCATYEQDKRAAYRQVDTKKVQHFELLFLWGGGGGGGVDGLGQVIFRLSPEDTSDVHWILEDGQNH